MQSIIKKQSSIYIYQAFLLLIFSLGLTNTFATTYSVQIDKPGFYIATVNLPEGSKEGLWGVEFKTSGGINSGGFNSGAILKEDGDRPGFMGFYLSQAESVRITPYEYTGAVNQMKVQLSRQENGERTMVFGPKTSSSGQAHTTSVLQPGFYVAEAFSQSGSARGRFGFEVSAKSMIGGVNIGGWIDSYTGGTGEGFGGLYVGKSQVVDITTFFGDDYGSIGSGELDLNVYLQENGSRTQVFSSKDSIIQSINEIEDDFLFGHDYIFFNESDRTDAILVEEGITQTGIASNIWPNGSILTVSIDFSYYQVDYTHKAPRNRDFKPPYICPLDTTTQNCETLIQKEIENAAKIWSQYGNIHFKFGTDFKNSDIRIRFLDPVSEHSLKFGGYSSVGRSERSPDNATMTLNLEKKERYADGTEVSIQDQAGQYKTLYLQGFRRTVLHEFGHTIGLRHEHQHPSSAYTWDPSAIKTDMKGWTDSNVSTWITSMLDADEVTSVTEHDANSIMSYSIKSLWVSPSDRQNPEKCPSYISSNGEYCVEPASTLSDLDKQTVAKLYPYSSTTNSCTYSISPSNTSSSASGGTGSINISTQSGCIWSASENANWVSLNPSSGTGSGRVTYTISQNTSSSNRNTNLNIAGKIFAITQIGYTSTSVTTIPNKPTELTATALSSSEIRLNWTDNSNNEDGFSILRREGTNFVIINTVGKNSTSYIDTGLKAGTTYYYIVSAYNNAGPNYSDYVSKSTISASSCTYSISPVSASISASGGIDRITISTQSGCTWSASENANWVSLSPSSGTGSGRVTYTISQNTSSSNRNTNLNIAGKIFTVTQAGTTIQKLKLISPNGGESWIAGRDYTVTWNKDGAQTSTVIIYLYKDGQFIWHNAEPINNTGSYTITLPSFLETGNDYKIGVQDYSGSTNNDFSDNEFTISSSTTTVNTSSRPNKPTGLTATALSSSEIRLNWSDNSNNEDGFYIWWWDGYDWKHFDTVGKDTTSYVDDIDLEAGVTYSYTVSAYNAVGESDYADYASATTLGGSSSTNAGILSINVSGMSNSITIYETTEAGDIGSYSISGMNENRVFYLSKDNLVDVDLSGMYNNIYIPESLYYNNMNYTGSGIYNEIIFIE